MEESTNAPRAYCVAPGNDTTNYIYIAKERATCDGRHGFVFVQRSEIHHHQRSTQIHLRVILTAAIFHAVCHQNVIPV